MYHINIWEAHGGKRGKWTFYLRVDRPGELEQELVKLRKEYPDPHFVIRVDVD